MNWGGGGGQQQKNPHKNTISQVVCHIISKGEIITEAVHPGFQTVCGHHMVQLKFTFTLCMYCTIQSNPVFPTIPGISS